MPNVDNFQFISDILKQELEVVRSRMKQGQVVAISEPGGDEFSIRFINPAEQPQADSFTDFCKAVHEAP